MLLSQETPTSGGGSGKTGLCVPSTQGGGGEWSVVSGCGLLVEVSVPHFVGMAHNYVNSK